MSVENNAANITVVLPQPEHHWRRLIGVGALGAAAVLVGNSALHGCNSEAGNIDHTRVHGSPFAAIGEITIPNTDIAVRAENARGLGKANVYVAACTPKPHTDIPFLHTIADNIPQACSPAIGWFNGDTAVTVKGHLNVLAASESIALTADRDNSKLGWHLVALVNRDAYSQEFSDAQFTSAPLHTGLGNSFSQVAKAYFHNPNADAGTLLTSLESRTTNAIETACTSDLTKYIPAEVAKEARAWVNGSKGIQKAKYPDTYFWLTQLAKPSVPVHEVFLPTSQFEEAVTTAGDKVKARGQSSGAPAPNVTVNKVYETQPDPATGIRIAVPHPVPKVETYRSEEAAGTKKFQLEIRTDSHNCQVDQADQNRLEQLRKNSNYFIDAELPAAIAGTVSSQAKHRQPQFTQ